MYYLSVKQYYIEMIDDIKQNYWLFYCNVTIKNGFMYSHRTIEMEVE